MKPAVLVITNDKNFLDTLHSAVTKLNMRVFSSMDASSRDFLARPWHAIVVDSTTPGIDSVSILSLARSLSPFALRGLVVPPTEDPQLLLRAVNEARVHCVWIKPVSAKDIVDALQRGGEVAAGRTAPLFLVTALESKGGTGYGHSYRVAQYAMVIAKELGLSESLLESLQLGCLFHDAGKLLLAQKSSLEERSSLHQHPILGEQLAKEMGLPADALGVIRHHHERWDGQGYPDRLQGEEIPLLARIASLADAYDHLTEPEKGKPRLSRSEIDDLLRSEMGKAFDPDIVRTLINLREDQQDVWEVLERVTELPALAPIVQRVLVMLEREDFDWREVAEAIAQDQNLAAQILKLANSALTGVRRRVTNLMDALRTLGARAIKNLLLTTTVRPFLQTATEFQLWEHSLACALVARRLAQQTQLVDPEEAFTAGLLHDIGKALLLRHFRGSYKRAWQIARQQGCPVFLTERLIFGVTHAEIGAWLLERWRIPSPFCEAVAMHHVPAHETQPLCWHIYWANRFLHFVLDELPSARWVIAEPMAASISYPFIVDPEQLVREAISQVNSVKDLLF